MKGPVQSVEVSYLVHATEDGDRLGKAVRERLKIGPTAEIEDLEGHFGNRILRARHHLTGEDASLALASLSSSLTAEARRELLGNLAAMIDEHSALYVRLDKQSFLAGGLSLSNADPVRVRVKPRLFIVRGGAAEFFREALGTG